METGTKTKTFTVPQDVLLDVFKVILRNEITSKVVDMERMKSALVVELKVLPRHRNAVANIKHILSEYNYFRYGDDYVETEEV